MFFCKFFVIFVSTVVSVCAYTGVPGNVVSRVSAVYTVTPVVHLRSSAGVFSVYILAYAVDPRATWPILYRPHRRVSLSSSLVALLLMLSGIESNPGPEMHIGSLNARSVVRKGPLIQELT